jgi:hypothetical protein
VAEHHCHYHCTHNLFCRHALIIRHFLTGHIHQVLIDFLVEKHDPRGVPFSSKEDQDQCFDLLHDVVDILSRAMLLRHGRELFRYFWPWLCDLCEVK